MRRPIVILAKNEKKKTKNRAFYNLNHTNTGVPYSVLVGIFYDEVFKDVANDLL